MKDQWNQANTGRLVDLKSTGSLENPKAESSEVNKGMKGATVQVNRRWSESNQRTKTVCTRAGAMGTGRPWAEAADVKTGSLFWAA